MKWKDIPGYDGHYQASDMGQIKSLKWGKQSVFTPSFHRARSSHLVVNLTMNGVSRPRLVHQLILETFVGPRRPGEMVRHLNDDPTDNRLVNLKYGTQKENSADMMKNGYVYPKGDKARAAKLSADQVRWVRENKDHLTQVEMGKKLKISRRTVGMILLGRSYGDIL